MKNKYLLGLLLLVTISIVAISCRESLEIKSADLPRESRGEKSYKYSQTITLTDPINQFHEDMVISSDSKEAIENYIRLKPKIKISKELGTITGSSLEQLDTKNNSYEEHASDVSGILVELKNGNTPSGYSVGIYYESNEPVATGNARLGESYSPYEFRDDLAKSVYTQITKGNYQIGYTYYSKPGKWYEFGWVERGYITHYGANYNYNFVAVPKYTTTLGVKFSFYTTPSAAASTYHKFSRL